MATDKQIAANRRNARLSTGPRTAAGKARSSLNALRHGLRARSAILPGESRPVFRRLFRSLRAHLQPSGPLQELLVEQMAIAYWKLSRLSRIEAEVFAIRSEDSSIFGDLDEALFSHDVADDDQDETDQDQEPEPEPTPPTPDQILGRAYFEDTVGANTLTRLSQYEMRIERSFYRAWRELRRLKSGAASLPADPIPPER